MSETTHTDRQAPDRERGRVLAALMPEAVATGKCEVDDRCDCRPGTGWEDAVPGSLELAGCNLELLALSDGQPQIGVPRLSPCGPRQKRRRRVNKRRDGLEQPSTCRLPTVEADRQASDRKRGANARQRPAIERVNRSARALARGSLSSPVATTKA